MSLQDQETTKTRKAIHKLVDENGSEVEREEDATGASYTDVATQETIVQQTGGKAGEPITMWAVFGLKTLMTNVASGARQAGFDGEQVAAIKDRIQLNLDGKWMDRTREVAQVKPDELAEASVRVLIDQGRVKESDTAMVGKIKAALRSKFEDQGECRKALLVEGVRGEYNKLIGKKTNTVDDLATLAGISA